MPVTVTRSENMFFSGSWKVGSPNEGQQQYIILYILWHIITSAIIHDKTIKTLILVDEKVSTLVCIRHMHCFFMLKMVGAFFYLLFSFYNRHTSSNHNYIHNTCKKTIPLLNSL